MATDEINDTPFTITTTNNYYYYLTMTIYHINGDISPVGK